MQNFLQLTSCSLICSAFRKLASCGGDRRLRLGGGPVSWCGVPRTTTISTTNPPHTDLGWPPPRHLLLPSLLLPPPQPSFPHTPPSPLLPLIPVYLRKLAPPSLREVFSRRQMWIHGDTGASICCYQSLPLPGWYLCPSHIYWVSYKSFSTSQPRFPKQQTLHTPHLL